MSGYGDASDTRPLEALYRQGRYEEAAAGARRQLMQHPTSVRLCEIFGAASLALGRNDDAIDAFRKAVGLAPERAALWHNLGCALIDAFEDDEAADCLGRALALAPGHALAIERLGFIKLRRGDAKSAIDAFRRALVVEPNFARAHDGLGRALLASGREHEAVDASRRSVALEPACAEFHHNLAVALQASGDDAAAIGAFEAALSLAPLSGSWSALAVSLEAMGRIEEARAALGRAIELDPEHADARRNLSRLTRYAPGDPRIAELREALARAAGQTPAESRLAFALSKALIDAGEDREGFAILQKANRLHRATFAYDISEDAAQFGAIRRMFDAGLAESGSLPLPAGPTPIFIVGMPRSGSTLVEQILASHAQVRAAGELNLLNALIRERIDFGAAGGVRKAEASVLHDLGRAYLDSVGAMSGGAPFIVDKMPLNFRWVGAIRLALPHARVIHTMRDPRDACFSIYRQFFVSGGNRYAYDLVELAAFHNLYSALMAHWRETLPGFIHELQYETLVAYQEQETRRLLDYCGLPFEAACLSFERTERSVRTASAAQVREPMNDRSIGLWRRFEAELTPLIEVLT